MAARALFYSSSSSGEEEDTFSAFQVLPRPPVEKPLLLSLAPASSRDTAASDGVASSDEIGENGVLLKLAAPKRNGVSDSPPRKKKAAEAKGKSVSPPPPVAAAAEDEDAAPAAEDSDAETVTPPPASPAYEVTSLDDVILPPVEEEEAPYDEEERLRERSERYPNLWQMVLALEKKHAFPFLQKAFLKLSDARAAKLDGKVKNLYLQQLKSDLRRRENTMAVIAALVQLM